MQNTNTTITHSQILARLERAVNGAIREFENDREWYQEDDTTWVTVPAVVRVMRRTLGLPRHGYAPEPVFRFAVKMAEMVDRMYWKERLPAEVIVRAAVALNKKRTRRLLQRARKGTLAA